MVVTRTKGVDVFVVERKGSDRLRPQSPLLNEDGGVVIVRCMGCGRVPDPAPKPEKVFAWGSGAGTANIRDALSRAPPGERFCAAAMFEWW